MVNKNGMDLFVSNVTVEELNRIRIKLGLEESDVVLPGEDVLITDPPEGFVGVYIPAFEEGNLRIPLSKFYLDVLEYYKCHLTYMHPLGTARIMVFEVLCKAYGGEPTVDLFRSCFQAGPAGDWVTIQKRGKEFYKQGKYDIRQWKSSYFFLNVEKIDSKYHDVVLNPSYERRSQKFRDPEPVEFDRVLYERLWNNRIELVAFPEAVLFMAGVAPFWEHQKRTPVAVCDNQGRYFDIFGIAYLGYYV